LKEELALILYPPLRLGLSEALLSIYLVHSPNHKMSTWASIRSNVIIPLLPYYYVAVACTAFWINPQMFAISMLVILTIVVLIGVLYALTPGHESSDSLRGSRAPKSRWDGQGRPGREEECESEHEQECLGCMMEEEFARAFAQRLWEEKVRAQQEAAERNHANTNIGKRSGGKKKNRKR